MNMNNLAYGALFFAISSLVGPAIVLAATWWGATPMNLILYEFIALIWPFWLVAQYDTVMGSFQAIGLAVLLNVAAFSGIGIIAGASAKHSSTFILLFALVLIAQFAFSFVTSGGLAHMNFSSLALAGLFLAIPFAMLALVRT